MSRLPLASIAHRPGASSPSSDRQWTDRAAKTYDAHAPHYDLFTAHHDYEAWTRDLERVCVEAGLRGRRLLDVACGTGKSFLPFLARGYQVTACDISQEMVAVAENKARGRARLTVCDMRQLPLLGSFDLICCLDDSLNYCDRPEELAAAFAGMEANLAPGGVLVFDVNTLTTYRTFFAGSSVIESPDTVLVWAGRTGSELMAGEVAVAEHIAFDRRADELWTRTVSVHHQRHHPRDVVEGALEAAGLRVRSVHGMQLDGSFVDGYEESENSKAVFVAGH